MAVLEFFTKAGQIVKIDEDKEIHRGGEGRIIIPEKISDKVAKIYHENVKPISLEKFAALQKIKNKYFILPEELLFDSAKNVKGYVMQLLSQNFFPIASIFNKNFCSKNNISILYKKEISKKLIEIVKIAHDNKIIIGDLNQYNVLITKSADLKIIDTDSFATENIPHSEVLLEDIRDYFHGGKVNFSSDFFALSVLIFNLFTFTHPFKGIHRKYKSLAERMINKLPVFVNDNELIVPKCYEPVNDKKLKNQFEIFYLKGDRFLFSLDGVAADILHKMPVKQIEKIEKNNLIIKALLPNVNVLDIYFNNSLGYIETEVGFIVYNSENKGFISKIIEISKVLADEIYLGTKNIFYRKNEKLYYYISENETIEIANFNFTNNCIIKQYENILMVLTEDILYKIELDKLINKSIQVQRTNVFGRGFKNKTFFVQNTGGIQRIFYNTGKDVSNVKVEDKILDIKQKGNFAMVQYSENNSIKNKFLKINGLAIEQTNFFTDYFCDFALIKTDKDNGFVIVPDDNKINIIRTMDFTIVNELDCDIITQQTKLEYSKSGIFALENGHLHSINNK